MCVRLHSETSEPTMLISQTTANKHLPMPPPFRWPALITIHTLVKFQLVWHRLCDFVLFRSYCKFECTPTAVYALPEHHSCRKYDVHSNTLT